MALDVGGTKIEVGLVLANGVIVERQRIGTVDDGGDPLTARVVDLMQSFRRRHQPELIGVGCGGPLSPDFRHVSPLNIPSWRDLDLVKLLESSFDLPTFVDLDTKALALAEGTFGGARRLENFVSMVISTGVGGGLVIDGRLLDGTSGNAGHIGHVEVVPGGRPCACGARGCLEAEASGTAIALATGRPAKEATLAVRQRTGRLVGRAIGLVAPVLDVRHYFVAGSVALGYGDVFFQAANEEAARTARLSFVRDVSIEPSELGADGPLVGAALVGWRGRP